MIGNFIGDFVRGILENQFEKEIVQGIKLHREIDRYTDFHPLVKESQLLLKPVFFRYSSVITDMYFDYFLAKKWDTYHGSPLETFSREVYELIEKYLPLLPEKFIHAFKFMKEENWLVAYGSEDGIQRALTGLSYRTTFKSNLEFATTHLMIHHDKFEAYFDEFFPELIAFAKATLLKFQQEHDSE